MKKILVVEDDPAILRGIADNLRFEGYDVQTAMDGESAYRAQQTAKTDLIVLDLMLPRMSGFDFCKKLRAEGVRTPILILSARSQETDRISGLDLGADDYMTKPFSVRELAARIRAILRRVQDGAALPAEVCFGDVEVDFRRYETRRNGKLVEMTRKEFAILRLLASRSGEVVTRDQLLDEVWGFDAYPASRTVDNHVAGLRAKLERDPANPAFILTVHGVGYKFVRVAIS
jgi:DNA-binding response OmpR family regulator